MFGWLHVLFLCSWASLSSPLLINCWIVRRKKQNLEKEINGVENKWWWWIEYQDTYFLQHTLFLYLSFITSLMIRKFNLGKTSKKIKCIFYDIVLKGRGVKDQNQISEKIWNYDKGFKGGRWKNLMSQIHLSNILFIMCIKQQYSHINVKILYSFQVMTFIVHFLYPNLSLCNN